MSSKYLQYLDLRGRLVERLDGARPADNNRQSPPTTNVDAIKVVAIRTKRPAAENCSRPGLSGYRPFGPAL
jgi:hypothetical protein